MAIHRELGIIPVELEEDLARGIRILKEGGCVEVYLLGSVAEGRHHPGSDLDFAVRGCPPESFFKLQGKLLMELGRSADLIDLDVDPELASFLEQESRLVHVG